MSDKSSKMESKTIPVRVKGASIVGTIEAGKDVIFGTFGDSDSSINNIDCSLTGSLVCGDFHSLVRSRVFNRIIDEDD